MSTKLVYAKPGSIFIVRLQIMKIYEYEYIISC